MRYEDILPGDQLSMAGRVTLTVVDVDPDAQVLHTSIGPVPFSNLFMLKKVEK